LKPLNRRLLIEINKEETHQGAFFVPEEEKVEEFVTAKVLSCAADCSQDYTGKNVVLHSFGVDLGGGRVIKNTFIGENHLICTE